MKKITKLLLQIFLMIILYVSAGCISPNQVNAQVPDAGEEFDRDYTLDATILGYTGIGGEIDGIRNPILKANKGDSVRITIINGEIMLHDIALEEMGIKSGEILQEGDSTSIIFRAEASDTYYCTIPGHRQAGMEGRFEVVEDAITEERRDEGGDGILPEKEGRALNLDFETGTLQDWSLQGDILDEHPVTGNPSPLHEEDMTIDPQDDYFFSSGGTQNYEATGTLTSVAFNVTRPFASFRVSGGALKDTRVELVEAGTDSVFFMISGNNHARLRPVVVNLEEYLNREIYIRIVDNETGISPIPYIGDDEWAHINFDEFLLYPERPEFSNELDPEEIKILPPKDPFFNAGLSAEEAVEAMEVPEGFSVTLAASEPDIVRPIGFAMDSRGRLWVAEANTYPEKAPEGEGKDRILIFEDTNGDGKLDSQKVFTEGLNLVSGIEVGHGGVWVGAAPELLFIPMDENGDKPAGPPEVLLDGWGLEDTHEVLNSFRWGPDGWLYGVHGVFTHSNVGKPGTPDDQRRKLNAGVWRYHPTKGEFEVFAEGTSNPWGIDFNDYGHPFVTVCVIPHLHHAIQGGRFQRQAGEHFNPYTYDDIKAIGDHVHWVGDSGPHAGNYRSGSKGGGHAHAGAMFYLGNEHWKQERNAIFMNNIHGYRVNVDHLERKGSGYVGIHGDDFLLTNDAWSQWLNFRYGPDGSVFVIDWYDKNQCHSPNPDVHDKTLGRIFKISHEQDKWVQVDLSEYSNEELVELQLHENDWYVRQARLLLQERGPDEDVHRTLKQILAEHPEVPRKLRALWVLHVTEGLSEEDLLDLLEHESEYIRGWAVQLLAENKEVSGTAARQFSQMAQNDESALVRLYLASALQRMELPQRWDIVEGLYSRSEDAEDANLPLMVWYAAEPLVEEDMDRAMELALEAELPDVLIYTIQRVGAIGSEEAKDLLEKVDQQLREMDVSHHSGEK
ncbi:MAG: PVC-type heme-binding CxxCH protein [Balneolaceae bacterium]